MVTDITDLLDKIENNGATAKGMLTADEFNRLVSVVIENQKAAAKVIPHVFLTKEEYLALKEPDSNTVYMIYEE